MIERDRSSPRRRQFDWDGSVSDCTVCFHFKPSQSSQMSEIGFFLCLNLHTSVGDSVLPVHQYKSFIVHIFMFTTGKPNPSPCRRHPFHARLISNRRVTAADHWQDVRLVCFDIKGSGMRYIHLQFSGVNRFAVKSFFYLDTITKPTCAMKSSSISFGTDIFGECFSEILRMLCY